jgi:putative membrane protein
MKRTARLRLLTAIYALIWLLLAIKPLERDTWLLENLLVFFAVGVLFATRRVFPLSQTSYTCLFIFLTLHSVGAHYSYGEVPYREWLAELTGNAVDGDSRNGYDRFVHFSYGLLLAYPIREVFLRVANVRGFWGYFLPLDFTMSSSMLYELIEWATAEIFGGDLGIAFLGAQGDPWDAQKDMALASLGALIAMSVVAAINWRFRRDFQDEWTESLRVKTRRPVEPGEENLAPPPKAKPKALPARKRSKR